MLRSGPRLPFTSWSLKTSETVVDELSAQNVSVRFRGISALSGVSLKLARREILGLIGPNGAGKTTLVNCLSGFQPLTDGHVLIAERDAGGMSPRDFRRAGVSRTFQAGRLFRGMSVLENLEVVAVGLGAVAAPRGSSWTRYTRLAWHNPTGR